ncbi:hypothetical protein [Szabonella alba]|uniref:Uncharacterized protein n=1 Tax=Szabonella alba TaxID=2804194 RepID=A0A8K0VAG5_9RHOB|nr:hypothetical protein [Szabonella alba]MBL4918624.1 hypothetical protein [Szabonella alba]
MDQVSGFPADPEYRKQVAQGPVLSLVRHTGECRRPLQRRSVIEVSVHFEGTIVRLHMEPELLRFFPERAREARNSFLRYFKDMEHEVCRESRADASAIRLPVTVRSTLLQALDRKLCMRLYRPLSGREAAGFLGLDKKAFRHLRKEIGIEPSERIPASRHGRSYSYAVFAVSDVIRMQSMIAALLNPGKGLAFQ